MSRAILSTIAAVALAAAAAPAPAAPRFSITYPAAVAEGELTGRLVLVFAPAGEEEPRLLVGWDQDAVPFFGIDVENWKAGEARVLDHRAFGFPLHSLDQLPPGDYRVQAVLNRYETFARGDGVTLSLPPDQGEGQAWNRKPGNLHSTPVPVRIGAGRRGRVSIVLDQKILRLSTLE